MLFFIGTGPVKGFAVTLSIGILTSMFTAVLASRAVVNLLYGGRRRGGVPRSQSSCRRSAPRSRRPASTAPSCSTSAAPARSRSSWLAEEGADPADDARRAIMTAAALPWMPRRRIAARRVRRPAGRGANWRSRAALAALFALLMILAYVSFRFQWKFSVGAVAALVHDVIITLGVFSIIQLSLRSCGAGGVLAVIGYSLNDTIVIFDRIRENMLKMRRKSTEEVMNSSLNQTLSRTIMTGVTTLLVLLALYFLGGEAIAGFSRSR
jgi:protein-export SecD/SecF family membrane protein